MSQDRGPLSALSSNQTWRLPLWFSWDTKLSGAYQSELRRLRALATVTRDTPTLFCRAAAFLSKKRLRFIYVPHHWFPLRVGHWFPKWAVPPPGGRWDYLGGRWRWAPPSALFVYLRLTRLEPRAKHLPRFVFKVSLDQVHQFCWINLTKKF
jgi:hypothetical protein